MVTIYIVKGRPMCELHIKNSERCVFVLVYTFARIVHRIRIVLAVKFGKLEYVYSASNLSRPIAVPSLSKWIKQIAMATVAHIRTLYWLSSPCLHSPLQVGKKQRFCINQIRWKCMESRCSGALTSAQRKCAAANDDDDDDDDGRRRWIE